MCFCVCFNFLQRFFTVSPCTTGLSSLILWLLVLYFVLNIHDVTVNVMSAKWCVYSVSSVGSRAASFQRPLLFIISQRVSQRVRLSVGLWQVMRHYGIPERLVWLLENLYSKCTSAVRVDGELTDWFNVIVGVRQGCNLSPYLFLLLLEVVLKLALKDFDSGVNVSVCPQLWC